MEESNPYLEVLEELRFLQKYARKNPRKYLGRSPSAYERGRLKRMASLRAQKIRDDCDDFITQRPDFPILSLPKSYQKMWLNKLLAVLVSYRTALLFDLITAKYESMAQHESRFKRIDACMD